MTTDTVITLATGILAFLGMVAGSLAWFYRRGRQEQVLANSVDKNTEATNLLAAQVGGLRDTLEAHAITLTEHHFRLKALEEEKIRVTVERSGSK